MLQLRVYGESGALAEAGRELEQDGRVRHLALAPALDAGTGVLTGVVVPEAADLVLHRLTERGIPPRDMSISRSDDIGLGSAGPQAALIWADVLGQAGQYARLMGRYLAFMVAAGVIAGFGVIELNQILIVGAMAVSPDALPIAATAIALVAGRGRLVARALVTLTLGLFVAAIAACVVTALLDATNGLPDRFQVGETALSGLTSVNATTIGVAVAAGVAGMLALETRASAGVGVAISVTTIPAAAYLGVAAGVGEVGKVPGAFAVLGVNIAMISAGGALTLLAQRRFGRRWRQPAAPASGAR